MNKTEIIKHVRQNTEKIISQIMDRRNVSITADEEPYKQLTKLIDKDILKKLLINMNLERYEQS